MNNDSTRWWSSFNSHQNGGILSPYYVVKVHLDFHGIPLLGWLSILLCLSVCLFFFCFLPFFYLILFSLRYIVEKEKKKARTSWPRRTPSLFFFWRLPFFVWCPCCAPHNDFYDWKWRMKSFFFFVFFILEKSNDFGATYKTRTALYMAVLMTPRATDTASLDYICVFWT